MHAVCTLLYDGALFPYTAGLVLYCNSYLIAVVKFSTDAIWSGLVGLPVKISQCREFLSPLNKSGKDIILPVLEY